MFDLSWGEMLVIGIVALVVLGPTDLLTTFRATGRWIGKMQKMAREFTRAMNEAADEAGVGEINKSLKAAANPAKFGMDSLKKSAGVGPETRKLAEKRAKESEEWAEKARVAREKRAAEVSDSAAEMESEAAAPARPATEADDTPGDDAARKTPDPEGSSEAPHQQEARHEAKT